MGKNILFVHGGGDEAACEEDRILAQSLQQHLGRAYSVHYPRMPLEEGTAYVDWKERIAKELVTLDTPAILVGHSVGGSILLKYLTEERVEQAIAGLFLLAAPYFGGDADWNYPELTLARGFARKLQSIPRIFLYQSRDDEVVPYAHLARYKRRISRATVRALEGRGHQFANDLSDVAEDIVGGETIP